MENIADYYYKELETSTNPGVLLTRMLLEIFSFRPDNDEEYGKLIMNINKAIRIYGKYNVYYAILSISHLDRLNKNIPIYNLLSAIILRKQIKEGRINSQLDGQDLTKKINNMRKKVRKAKKNPISLEYPFDD
jgi:hypothetical protein